VSGAPGAPLITSATITSRGGWAGATMSVSFLLVSRGGDTEFVASPRLYIVPVLNNSLL